MTVSVQTVDFTWVEVRKEARPGDGCKLSQGEQPPPANDVLSEFRVMISSVVAARGYSYLSKPYFIHSPNHTAPFLHYFFLFSFIHL